jgi:hypothetical protein
MRNEAVRYKLIPPVKIYTILERENCLAPDGNLKFFGNPTHEVSEVAAIYPHYV